MAPVDKDMAQNGGPSLEQMIVFGKLKGNGDMRAVAIFDKYEESNNKARFHNELIALVDRTAEVPPAAPRRQNQRPAVHYDLGPN